ncbi:MAG: SH3 domain-containing protein [Celeribacter sp.]|jgi:uncharacterized membrane protein
MKSSYAVLLALLWPGAVAAQDAADYPGLHAVTGVTSDDILNIRIAPDPGAEIIGWFPPDDTGVEVIALSKNGRWGKVSRGPRPGWASMAYLSPVPGGQDPRRWPVFCAGTEPFWSLHFDASAGTAQWSTPDDSGSSYAMTLAAPQGFDDPPRMAATLHADGQRMTLVTRAAQCSDGMSDRGFGLSVDLLRAGAGEASHLRGCCSMDQGGD